MPRLLSASRLPPGGGGGGAWATERAGRDGLRFNIPVDDAVFVGDGEGGGAVGDDAGGDEPVIGALALDAARCALGIEQLDHHVAAALVLACVVDGDDVGVIEPARDLGFAHEALDDLGLVDQLIGQELDGDLAAQGGVFAFVDGPHAAATEQPDDLVLPKGCADARIDRAAIGSRRGRGLRRRAWLCHDRTSSAMAEVWSISGPPESSAPMPRPARAGPRPRSQIPAARPLHRSGTAPPNPRARHSRTVFMFQKATERRSAPFSWGETGGAAPPHRFFSGEPCVAAPQHRFFSGETSGVAPPHRFYSGETGGVAPPQ